ncbi:hypothetical protein L596_023378 [Steinernema carpocapsae]|uniref:CHK kinase-like domain-containing protein n=1 Tax=Steinernema carpocapsae TaxID=34508 RepID=A0A4U5MDP7_STECR|nr:hypothetical protein L596_023378 [Steinernema carpocapsae]
MATTELAPIFVNRPTEFEVDSLNVSEFLSDSPFTVDWLLSSVQDERLNELAKDYRIESVSAYDISKGKGYFSKVYRTFIKFENLDKPYEVMLKVPGTESFNEDPSNASDEESVSVSFVENAHNLECDFYDLYAPHLDIPLVKMYNVIKMSGLENPGALLMESMAESGESYPLHFGSTKEMGLNIAKHLATMYKYFLCAPPESFVGKYKSNGIVSIVGNDIHFPLFEKVCNWKPQEFKGVYETFKEYANSRQFYMYLMTDVYKDLDLPVVLTHGDLWTNNIMWKKNPDGSVSNEVAAIIDWQMIHEGCLTNDLARYMCLCMDGDVRRCHENEILRFMYDRIVELLEEEGKSVSFTFEQTKKAYQANFLGQAMHAVYMIALVYSGENWTDEERPLKMAQREKMLLRLQFALEDGLTYFKDIPKSKLQ